MISTSVVADGSLLLAIPVAAAAGLVSFLSPCVLPLVPGYLSYITGLTGADLGIVATAAPTRATKGPRRVVVSLSMALPRAARGLSQAIVGALAAPGVRRFERQCAFLMIRWSLGSKPVPGARIFELRSVKCRARERSGSGFEDAKDHRNPRCTQYLRAGPPRP